MSGGVDSAVAALLLAESGYAVRGATLRLWPGEDERGCCSPAAVALARESAHALGLPHFSLSEEARFAERVVAPFVSGYEAGETPNPCVACNPDRLGRLVQLANRLGLGYVATGHYARIVTRDGRPYRVRDDENGLENGSENGSASTSGAAAAAAHGRPEPFVARGRDRAKDQSYMLWRVPPETLARLLLPLGELRKDEVRARAARAALPAAGRAESQEVCFAPGDYRGFLAARGARAEEGVIVTRDGVVVGTHRGQWRYTIGQRRGLGVAGERPLYVLERRPGTNEVVVGGREELETVAVDLRELLDRGLATAGGRRLVDGEEVGAEAGLRVQLRYKAGAIGVRRLRRLAADRARLTLAKPFAGVAPGQSAVFYRDDVVVGGGIIVAPARREDVPSSA